jgi:hypothetical protein
MGGVRKRADQDGQGEEKSTQQVDVSVAQPETQQVDVTLTQGLNFSTAPPGLPTAPPGLPPSAATAASAPVDAAVAQAPGPLKLVLSSNMHVKKRGISGERYIMHHCTLSYAEGSDGWTSYRLAYRDSQTVEHAATVIGMSDNAPTRYEFTIVTHENQGYSIRCGTNAEYTQWTDAIKQIVAPPLSRAHASLHAVV